MQISNKETKAKSKDITLISLLRALESHLPMAISCYFIKAFRSHIIFLCKTKAEILVFLLTRSPLLLNQYQMPPELIVRYLTHR